MNYSKAIQSESFPKKDQAIVIKHYITEITKYTSPSNIRFILRISGKRVCIYLTTKANADDLTDNKRSITINNQPFVIRPLIDRVKRIIISNACPVIPHSVLEGIFNNLNITLESKISFIQSPV